ncbi:MAG: GNAT family N-acetyltransferase [Bacteroidales bacterium]|jgi:GNAT superfamily N-acetyltransferase
MEIFYIEITSSNDIHFADAIKIYFDSFPSNERQPLPVMKKRIEEGRSKLYVGFHRDEIVCIAFMYHFNRSDFVFLDYMAVIERFRNHKIGSSFFSFLIGKVVSAKKYLLLEVENYLFGNNIEQRKKRINFYVRNGAYLLKGTPYVLPSLDNTIPTDMSLMIAPKYKKDQLENKEIEIIFKLLYFELYEKTESDTQLHAIIKSIPSTVTLVNQIIN